MNIRFLLLFTLFVSISSFTCSGSNKYIDKSLKSKEYFSNLASTPESFQLFSHGKPGELFIEGKWLTATQIATWFKKSKRLKGIPHLNIYACEFGKGVKGQNAVVFLEKSLNITLAASDDITGADGDWDLEVGTRKDVLEFPNYPYSLQNEFITTWEVSSGDLDITIPTRSWRFTYDYNVDWGDGIVDSGYTKNASHTYASAGTYTVKISGAFPQIYLFFSGEEKKIRTIEEWGNIVWESMDYSFVDCSNLTIKDGIEPPNLSLVKDMSWMFGDATSLDADVSAWDVSTVKNMSYMFAGATSFTGKGINKWNVGSVKDMSWMFNDATSLDADVSAWDVSNVTDMSYMFSRATSFTGKGIDKWDVGNVNNMYETFGNAKKFDADLSGWNPMSVTEMGYMFFFAESFQGIGLNNWNVSTVSNMKYMFNAANSFIGDVSNWDVSNVTQMDNMFEFVTLSPDMYTSLLNSWAILLVNNDVRFSGGGSKYCDDSGRNILVSKGWIIKDGGKIASGTVDLGSDIDNCQGTLVTLNAGNYPGVTYLWNTGETSQIISVDTLGVFSVEVSFASGCVARDAILVKDDVPPVLPTLANVVGECTAIAIVPATIDNCSGTITGTTIDPLTYNTEGSYVINWTFDDGNGNSITVPQNVIVDDVTTPVIPNLPDLTGECSITAVSPTTTDNCSGTITGTSTDPLSYNTEGNYVIHWTFDDGNGNSISVPQNVIVDDVTAPVIPNLSDLTGECSLTAVSPTTTDNCSGTITGITTDLLSYNTKGNYVINWTFDDGNGNRITVPQNVIVDDVTDPVIPTLADVIGECTATAVSPTTTDNCTGTITGTTTDPLSYNTKGNYVINWTFDDGNGNSISVPQNVIVDDVTAPVIPNLLDLTGECSITAVSPTTTDNCSGIITGTTTDPLSYNTEGSYVIHWVFDDGNGNSITVPQNVIIDDVTAPVIPNLPDLTGECSITAVSPTTTDNCTGTITGTTIDPLNYNTEGSYVINWTFDDGNGNSITLPQNVIVDDVTVPIAPVLDDVSGMCTLSLTVPTASDNCAGEIQGTTLDPLTYNTEGSYIVNWTFDDGNGNSSRTAQNVDVFIIVEDVELSSYATELTCDVNNINLTANAKVQGKALYKWFKDGDLIPGEIASVLEIGNGEEGEYEVEVSDENLHCNVLSNPILITEDVVVPRVSISPLSGSLSSAESIIINAAAVTKGEASYIWSTGEITSSVEVKYPGKYSVEVIDNANGCSVNSSDIGQEAIIMNYWEENLLKAFTPNADGYNDSWRIERVELVQKLKIVVYDRWGKAIYKFRGTGNEYRGTPWKGTDGNVNLPIGSYYYVIKINDEKPMKGTVTILR